MLLTYSKNLRQVVRLGTAAIQERVSRRQPLITDRLRREYRRSIEGFVGKRLFHLAVNCQSDPARGPLGGNRTKIDGRAGRGGDRCAESALRSRSLALAGADGEPGCLSNVGMLRRLFRELQGAGRNITLRKIRHGVAARLKEQEGVLAINNPGSAKPHPHSPALWLHVQESLRQRFGHEKMADCSRRERPLLPRQSRRSFTPLDNDRTGGRNLDTLAYTVTQVIRAGRARSARRRSLKYRARASLANDRGSHGH